jgi:hypothetical protein
MLARVLILVLARMRLGHRLLLTQRLLSERLLP